MAATLFRPIAYRAVVAAAALLLPSAPAAGQGPTAAGLLLGLRRDGEDGRRYQYVTLWITADSASARLVAQGPDLLVPRRDGFWWVAVRHYRDEGNEIDTLMVGPAGKGRLSHDTVGKAPECYANLELSLRFVGADHVGRETHAETGCSVHPDSPSTWLMAALPHARPFDSLISPIERAAFERRREFVRDSVSRIENKPNEECQPTEPGRDLFVTHRNGAWVLSAGLWGPYVCGSPYGEFETGIAPPRAVVGDNDLAPAWVVVRRTVHDAVDAVSSPQHNVVVVMTESDSILVYATTGTALGRRLGAFAGGGAVVMTQWAVGRFVPIWTAQVTGLLRQP